jgi:hypothetical protein
MSTVKLQAPDGASGVSVDGDDYRVDRGVIEVPASAEAVLRSHGYTTYVPKPTSTGGRGGSGGGHGKIELVKTGNGNEPI